MANLQCTPGEVASNIAILVTRRCNMSCAHCSVESAPRVDSQDPTESELVRILRDSAARGVRSVQFTGGEPMMRQKLVLSLMKEAQRLKMSSGLTTNGFWGKNRKSAKETIRRMMSLGLNYMAVSYDRYHAEFMGPEPILNLAAAARDLGFHFNVNVTRTGTDENQDEYARLFGNLPNVRMRLYDVQPVGRARNFDLPGLRGETEGFCNAAAQATFTEDGRLISCNGPAYFDKEDSPRMVGNLRDMPVAALLEKHWTDPILETLRTFGPAGLRDELLKDVRFQGSFDRRFAGQCDLCHHVTGNQEMTEHLNQKLADSSLRAMRAAKWSIIRGARSRGELSRDHANGPGMISLFYHRITTGQWPAQADHLLGRADIDWDHLGSYLTGCGVANYLVSAVQETEVTRWAPAYFREAIQKRSMRDALRELSHREALDELHKALEAQQIRGILLKGAAIYLQEKALGVSVSRVPGDIDLWIESPEAAERFRNYLLDHGFRGDANATRTGPHHLAPVLWQNSMIEIHTGVMPGFWGLPELRMGKEAIQIKGWARFYTLSPDDLILHEVMHSTTHLFNFGLKLAVDLFRIDRVAQDLGQEIGWDEIGRRANSTRCAKAFWAPLKALYDGMPGLLPVPESAFGHGPRDENFRRMTLVADKRLFTSIDRADDMNPFSRNGIFLLLHDGWLNRLRYLSELGRGDAAESRRTAMQSGGRQSWKELVHHLRNAWIDLKHYRRAIGR